MTGSVIGVLGIVVLFVLLFLRIPVAFAMFMVGFFGIVAIDGMASAMSLVLMMIVSLVFLACARWLKMERV